jgi:predicted GNAT superfamily acetyltransferase
MSAKTMLRILENPEEMAELEALQRSIWPGDDTDVVPSTMLLAVTHNGGLAIGAYERDSDESDDTALEPSAYGEPPPGAKPVGFVFGFPGLYFTPDGPRPKHCSHMLGVLPGYRNRGLGFLLKRAQWQMVRRQGLDRITWTFDPLMSPNAHLNITRLGAVCSTYLRDAYGDMRDGLNAGLPSDRFQVDWWINTARVNRRLSSRARQPLDLGHFISAGTELLNPPAMAGSLLRPGDHIRWEVIEGGIDAAGKDAAGVDTAGVNAASVDAIQESAANEARLALVEIPADFQAMRSTDPALAFAWRVHTRELFERLFAAGYLVTDFVHVDGEQPRSFYVLVHGESTF